MATGNLFLGTARKKLGDVVLMRRNGEQVSRIRVIPRNPQSDMQTISRLALSTASKVATVLPFVNHSFQSVQYGQKSVNHFIKSAAKVLRSYAIAAYCGENSELAPLLPYPSAGLGVAAPIVIASGDLSTGKLAPVVAGNVVKIGTILGDFSEGIHVSDFEDFFGFPWTDQITFIVGMRVEDESSAESESVMAGIQFRVARLNFKTDLDDSASLFNVDQNDSLVLNIDSVDVKRSSAEILNLGINTHGNMINVFDGDTGSYTCAAIIVSRYENNAWRRSNATLVQGAPGGITSTAQGNTAFGWNYITDLVNISKKGSSVSEDRYLNKEPNA